MKALKILFLFVIAIIIGWIRPQGCAADVPAGTTIWIMTTKNIISNDSSGWPFEGVITSEVAVAGRVVFPIGTPVCGVVKSPHFTIGSTSRPLTLRLTGVTSHGHTIPIETEDRECESNSPWTVGANRRVQINGDAFIYNAGTIIPFHLKQPVKV